MKISYMVKEFKQIIQNLLDSAGLGITVDEYIRKNLTIGIIVWVVTSVGFYLYSDIYNWYAYVLVGFVFFVGAQTYMLNNLLIKSSKSYTSVDDYIPDFLSLMASNIRSGMTYEKALIASARKEFGLLTKHIDFATKQIIGGKAFDEALIAMAKKVGSPKFSKTVRLIIEGLHSGGNLADLIETTSYDMRRFEGLRKEITTQFLAYALFIFAASTIGAPLLYAVAAFLITILFNLGQNINYSSGSAGTYLPTIGAVQTITPDTMTLFSIAAITITCFFGALSAGTIFSNDEKKGLTYFPIILIIAIAVFFGTKAILGILFGAVSLAR